MSEPVPERWFPRGVRAALGAQISVMIASHIGFGAFAQASGLGAWTAVFTTIAIWALPGQLVLVESWVLGVSWVAIVPAVMLTAARFLPMTVSLMPLLRHPRHAEGSYYGAAHLLSMMSWAMVMPRVHEIPLEERLPYFFGFALTCWTVSMGSVALGFLLAGSIGPELQLALVMITPITFVLVLSAEMRHPRGRFAVGLGAIGGPLLHVVAPKWDILLTGLLAGTAAYFLGRRRAGADGG